jgi:hypothetical protein
MKEALTVVRPNGTEFSVDLTELRGLEARQAEASGCGRVVALGLMTSMKEGYELAATARANITLEMDRAQTALATRKAIVCLDLIPDILKAKGLATPGRPGGTAEQKEDILAVDKDYIALKNYIGQLEAARELMRIKMETFRMAFSTAKRNFDDTLAGMLPKGYNGGATEAPQDASAYVKPQRQLPQIMEPTPGPVQQSQTAPGGTWSEDFGIQIGKARY